MNTFPQVTVDDKGMIKRWHHTVTAIIISSSLVVVVVFGGRASSFNNELSNTVVLEFGENTVVVMYMYRVYCTSIMCYEHRCLIPPSFYCNLRKKTFLKRNLADIGMA